MITLLNKLKYALRGLYIAITKDTGFQWQVGFFVVSLPILYIVFSPFSNLDILLILIGYGFLWITELQNSALEISLDRLHPELHDSIKDSKDIAAASVLISSLIFLGLVVFFALERGII